MWLAEQRDGAAEGEPSPLTRDRDGREVGASRRTPVHLFAVRRRALAGESRRGRYEPLGNIPVFVPRRTPPGQDRPHDGDGHGKHQDGPGGAIIVSTRATARAPTIQPASRVVIRPPHRVRAGSRHPTDWRGGSQWPPPYVAPPRTGPPRPTAGTGVGRGGPTAGRSHTVSTRPRSARRMRIG